MMRALAAAGVLMLLFPLAGPGEVRVRAAAMAADPMPRPPKFNYTMDTLPNGLQVVYLEDHSTPIVHLAVWYHVGSKDEKAGRTGFAHLFEHLMFKGSKNVGPDEHPSSITGIGGQSNAFTTEDETVFWETVPSQYLPFVLWLEADRMASLQIDETKFKNEREVVKEERRMRFDNQPFGNLSEILNDKAFTVSGYKHETIGSMADLEAATTQDVINFHDTYYVPNNATVAIVGDFDSAMAKELVQQYMARVPKGKPVPRDWPKEPPQTAERRFTLQENWPLPAVIVAYHTAPDATPDAYPTHVLDKIMTDGDSSRIYRDLVYEKRLALAAFGEAKIIEQPNLMYAVAIVQPGNKPEDVLRELIAQFDRLKTEPVSDAELNRAKRQWARDYILGRETIQQKALHLAHAIVIHNDIKSADGEFDLFQAVTAGDIMRIAQTYFKAENRTVLTVMPRGSR
jgi:zinc protease